MDMENANPQPSSSPITQQNQNIPLIIGMVLFLLLVGGGAYYLGTQKSDVNPPLSTQQSTPPVLPTAVTVQDNQPTATVAPSLAPTSLTKVCKNDALGVELKLPNSWICTSESTSEVDGWITIKSDIFDITVANAGRGIYCESDSSVMTYSPDCKTSQFYANSVVTLTLFSDKGGDREIFGSIIGANQKAGAPKPWMSIKYQNMEKQSFTPDQQYELISVLDSLSPLK